MTKDRNAWDQNRSVLPQGVSSEEAYGGIAAQRGIPMHQVREGVIPAQRGLPPRGILSQGVPEPTPKVKKNVCLVKKKDGSDCKARPIRGETYCVGHGRTLKNDISTA